MPPGLRGPRARTRTIIARHSATVCSVLLAPPKEQSAVRSFNLTKRLVATMRRGDLRGFAYGGCASCDRIRSVGSDGAGRRDYRHSTQSWPPGTLTAPRQLATRGHAFNAHPIENQPDSHRAQRLSVGRNYAPAKASRIGVRGQRSAAKHQHRRTSGSHSPSGSRGLPRSRGLAVNCRAHAASDSGPTRGKSNDHVRRSSHRTRCSATAML